MTGLEPVIIAWLVARYLVRNFWQDGLHAWRGEDPPSFRREQERLKARQAKGEGPDTHRAAKRYFANAWNDAFETAEENRARRRAKRLRERHERWADEDGECREVDRDTPAAGGNEKPPASAPIPDPEQPAEVCSYCREKTATTISPNATGVLQPACGGCAGANERTASQDSPDPIPVPDVEPAPLPELEPVAEQGEPTGKPVDAEPATNVIAFPTMHTTKEESMSAEINGLRAAITWTAESALKAIEAASEVELAIAGLVGGGTTGSAIADLQAAQEYHSLTAEKYQAASAELTRQLAVREAYEANKGAGTKKFVTAD